MKISLEQLIALQAAAETGSFSAAARRLGKAQSAVSTAIANLEVDLDVVLFDRSGRYPQITPVGLRVLQEAHLILGGCQRLQALAGELNAGIEPRLTLAIDDASHLAWLDGVIDQFSSRYPMVELELLFPVMEDCQNMLLDGRAQLGVIYELQNVRPELIRRTLGQVRIPIVAAPFHQLAKRHSLTRADLQNERQLVVTARGGGNERNRFRFSSQVWWIEGDLAVLEGVKRGWGWAAVPAFLLPAALSETEVQELRPDIHPGPQTLGVELLWHSALSLGKAGSWLRNELLAREFHHGT